MHVMTVLMRDNHAEIEPLLKLSAARGVGHCITLLSKNGYRRGHGEDEWPQVQVSQELLRLWEAYPHFRVFRSYLERVGSFLSGGEMPACHAGSQSFNVDHLGNVSPCIEKIDLMMGNVRAQGLGDILESGKTKLPGLSGCQDCWTLCRGFAQTMGQGGEASGWRDLMTRMRSR